MKIFTIGNEKGGVGKSTIACNLAVEASKEGKRVLLIDSDPQASSLDFRAVRAESEDLSQFQAVSITTATIHRDVKAFNDFDYVFIDAGGRDTKIFRSAILASDPVLLIPILPGVYDIWATQGTIIALYEARTYREIEARIIINQVIPNTRIARDAMQTLNEFNIPVLATKLHARVDFKQSISRGMGVTEFNSTGKAAEEIVELWKEVKNI